MCKWLFHFIPDKLDEIASLKKVYNVSSVCGRCKKTFTRYSNLVAHVKKFHHGTFFVLCMRFLQFNRLTSIADKVDDLIKSPKTYNHTCDQCNKHFSHLRHFRSHQKTHGNDTNAKIAPKIRCILCADTYADLFVSKSELHDHFKNKHDILVSSKNFKFKNFEEFSQWKSKIQSETTSSFIKKHGSYSTKNYKKVTYECHRSGCYVAKGKGIN